MAETSITNKVFCVVTKKNYNIWITKKQFEDISNTIIKKKEKFIIFNNNIISLDNIAGVHPADEIERNERVKKGDFQCKGCKQWLSRGKECGICGGF